MRNGGRVLSAALAACVFAPAAAAQGAKVKAESLPVYSQTSAGSRVVGTLKRGDAVTIDFVLSGPDGTWCAIQSGYVRCGDLEREKPPEAPPAPGRSAPEVDQMLEAAGALRTLSGITDRNHLRLLLEKKKIDEGDAAVTRVLMESLRPEVSYLPVRRQFQTNYSKERVSALLEDFRAPLLRKMAGLELWASSPDAAHDLVSFAAQLQNNPAPERRLRLVARIEEATGASEFLIQSEVARFRGIVNAINPALAPEKRVTAADLEQIADELRSQYVPEVKKNMELRLLYTYQTATDGELEEYARFLETENGQWFTRLFEQGMLEAAEEFSANTLRRLRPSLPPPPEQKTAAPAEAGSAQEIYRQGLLLLDAGQPLASLRYFDWAIQRKPDYAPAYYQRGNAYRSAGQNQRAIADYSDAIRLDPQMALAYNNRGAAYKDLGQTRQAIQDYTQAIRADRGLLPAYCNRASAYHELGQDTRAVADLTEAIRLDPRNPSLYTDRGLAYTRAGQWQQGLQDCSAALQIDPRFWQAYRCRGSAYSQGGQYGRAIPDFDAALRRSPDDAESYLERATAYEQLGQVQRAFQDYSEAIRLRPRDGVLYGRRAVMRQRAADWNGALSDYEVSLRLNPKNAYAYCSRAVLMAKLGRDGDAQRDLNQCYTLDGSLRPVFEPLMRQARQRR